VREPFIQNHQYNSIRKQVGQLQHACATISDPAVVRAIRHSTHSKLLDIFPGLTPDQKQLLEQFPVILLAEQFQPALLSLEPYMEPFPAVTERELHKLFPKVKKLKTPDLSSIDFRYMTYLSWLDIATNKMFLVYNWNGRLVGVEGTFTPANKKGVCFLCNHHEEVALFTAISKSRPAGASPDYYRAHGNYMCVSSGNCNKNLTDKSALDQFIQEIIQ